MLKGSLVGIFTDTITNIATDGIEVNYEVVGDRLNVDTVVSSIGSSSVTLSQSTTNNIILVQEDGIFESSNGNLIVGIDTSNAVIGYGISNQYITQGTTISSVGLSSITISQAASNPASKLVKTGELTGIATNSITGINTSGIFENQLVFGEYIDSQTGISSIGQGEIFLTKNTTNPGLHTGSFDISFMRCIPNIVIACPSNEHELWHLLDICYEYKGPAAIRYPRGSGIGVEPRPKDIEGFQIGKAKKINDGQSVCILNFGVLIDQIDRIAEKRNYTF